MSDPYETVEHRVRVGNFEFSITDPQPLASAKLFKSLTDKIIELYLVDPDARPIQVPAVANPSKLLGKTNSLMLTIEQNHAIDQREPSAVRAQLMVFDSITSRYITRHGSSQRAKFLDGHRDYYRELGVHFVFDDEASETAYIIDRTQGSQDQTTNIRTQLWGSQYSQEAASYETPVTATEELQLLHIIAEAAGLDAQLF